MCVNSKGSLETSSMCRHVYISTHLYRVKPVLSRHSKIDKGPLKISGSLEQVKSIEECSCIKQLSVLKHIFRSLISDRLRPLKTFILYLLVWGSFQSFQLPDQAHLGQGP